MRWSEFKISAWSVVHKGREWLLQRACAQKRIGSIPPSPDVGHCVSSLEADLRRVGKGSWAVPRKLIRAVRFWDSTAERYVFDVGHSCIRALTALERRSLFQISSRDFLFRR